MPSPYQPYDSPEHDLGPWIESPGSSRMSRYRYDYAADTLQVTWANDRGHSPGTVYEGVGSDIYRRMARAASKGKFVNRILDGFSYRPADPDEFDAPSNPDRSVVQHRE